MKIDGQSAIMGIGAGPTFWTTFSVNHDINIIVIIIVFLYHI